MVGAVRKELPRLSVGAASPDRLLQPQVAPPLWEGRGLQGDHARDCLSQQKGNDHTSLHQILINC